MSLPLLTIDAQTGGNVSTAYWDVRRHTRLAVTVEIGISGSFDTAVIRLQSSDNLRTWANLSPDQQFGPGVETITDINVNGIRYLRLQCVTGEGATSNLQALGIADQKQMPGQEAVGGFGPGGSGQATAGPFYLDLTREGDTTPLLDVRGWTNASWQAIIDSGEWRSGEGAELQAMIQDGEGEPLANAGTWTQPVIQNNHQLWDKYAFLVRVKTAQRRQCIVAITVNVDQSQLPNNDDVTTAKGDLAIDNGLAASGEPRVMEALTAGADGTLLVADSAEDLGVKWATLASVADGTYLRRDGTNSMTGDLNLDAGVDINADGVNTDATIDNVNINIGTGKVFSQINFVHTGTIIANTKFWGPAGSDAAIQWLTSDTSNVISLIGTNVTLNAFRMSTATADLEFGWIANGAAEIVCNRGDFTGKDFRVSTGASNQHTLFVDGTNHRVGIEAGGSPDSTLHVVGTTHLVGSVDLDNNYLDMDNLATPANPAAGTRRLFVDSGTGQLSVRTSAGSTVSLEAGAGGGEANTASNQGAGVGVFDGKVGVDLEFRSLVAASTRISVSLDGPNKEIDLDVNQANIDHDALTNFFADEHVAHSSISVIAGDGLSGGGTINGSVTLDVGEAINGGIQVNANTIQLAVNDLTVGVLDTAADYIAYYDTTGTATKRVLVSAIDHDALTNFVAAEHIDWSVTGAEQIHADRYTAGGSSYMLGFSAAAAIVAKGITDYLGVGTGAVTATEANAQFQVEMAGTIDKLRGYVSANATGAAGNNLTIRKNGVATSLTVTWGSGETGEKEDTSNSFTVAAGDLVSIEQVNAGSGGGTKDLVVESVSFRLTPS